MDGGGFIRELCVALEHRWKPEEVFLLFTAYLDEADTHGKAPTIIMSAMLGNARQWELFGRKLRKLQHKEQFVIFHGKEIKHEDEVRGRRIVSSLVQLTRDELTEGVVIHLEHEVYVQQYRNSHTPKGISLDSHYGVCFRLLLMHIVNNLRATGKRHKLHIVIERGHHKARNCEKIFYEIKETIKTFGEELLGDFTIASKDDAPPLMVADMLAHSYMLMRRPNAAVSLDRYISESPPQKGEAGLSFLEINPDSLPNLKLLMAEYRQRRRAYVARQKAEARTAVVAARSRVSSGESPC